MKKIIVMLTLIALLTSCVSTDLLNSKSSGDFKNAKGITESQHNADMSQVVITYYVKGIGGTIAVKIGDTDVKEAVQTKHSISVEKGSKITFIAYPEDNYEIVAWSSPFSDTIKQSVDLVVVENLDIYVMFRQKKLATIDYGSYSHKTQKDYDIHIGPRGGKYYINKNGKKTYIKKKKR